MEKVIKPIPGHPGYFVRNYGEVYSKWASSGRGAHIGSVLHRLKLVSANGRVSVNLARKSRRVHTLVLEAFVGPRPNGMEACHFPDRSTANNRLDNLRWDTKQSNQNDRRYHGTSNDGERNGSAKLTKVKVKLILMERADGATYKELSEAFGVSISNIQQICQRKTWQTIEE